MDLTDGWYFDGFEIEFERTFVSCHRNPDEFIDIGTDQEVTLECGTREFFLFFSSDFSYCLAQ